MSDTGQEISVSHDAEISDIEPNPNGLTDDTPIAPKDIHALTLAITGIADAVVRRVLDTALPSLVQPLIEHSLETILPETLPKLVTEQLPAVTQEQLRHLGPTLMESAVGGQEQLMRQIVEGVTREALPGLIGPIVERLAKDTIQAEVQKFMSTGGLELVEKIAWEIVPSQAEIEVKKEIERLTAEA